MSDEWITVGKNNKPLRGSKGNQQPINGPKGNKKHLHQPGKLPKLPSGPPIQGSLLGIPPELRIKIWEYGLPSGGTINLSAPRPLARHRGWQCGTQRRYDPSVLSINRQIYNEASDVLYRRNFIVEVNCGLWTEHTSVRISHEVFEGERTRYTELPRKFPFHRAKHITIRIDAHVQCNTDHVFHHMVYVCGLLFVATKSIESLSVEIWAEDSHGRVLSYECPSWKSTGRNGFAEAFGIEKFRYWEQDEENASTKHVDDRIAFLLQPLELRKRVDKGDIVFCSLYQPSENLANTMDYYRALLRGEIHTNNRETNWLRSEYFLIITKRKENAKQVQQERKQHHEEWLQRIHEEYDCRHNRFKPYRRNAHCEGCGRWLESLTRCRLCDMKACETCRADLREKWSALEKKKRVREGGYLLPWTRGKAGKASG